MRLTKEATERIAIITTPNEQMEFISLDIKDEKLNIVLKDLKDSYYTNNFEDEVYYSSDDDKNRYSTLIIDLNTCRIYNSYLTMLSQIHTFESYLKSNKFSVRKEVVAHEKKLIKLISKY